MNQNLSRPASSRLKPTSPAEAFCADLLMETRWVAGNLNGVPQPRMEDELDFGILPEPYHAAARGAAYAVFHFETLYEYLVAVDRDGDRAPREFWWPEWAVREALPFDYYDALKEEMSHE